MKTNITEQGTLLIDITDGDSAKLLMEWIANENSVRELDNKLSITIDNSSEWPYLIEVFIEDLLSNENEQILSELSEYININKNA